MWVLRCWRTTHKVYHHTGKAVRKAIRHHWYVGHHVARVIWHSGVTALSIGAVLTCVMVSVHVLSPSPLNNLPLNPPVDVGHDVVVPIYEPSSLTILGGAILCLYGIIVVGGVKRHSSQDS